MGGKATRVMYFEFAGVVSEEECGIATEDGSSIELDNGFRFDSASGECLNDETYRGARRFLDPDPVTASAAGDGLDTGFLSAYPDLEEYMEACMDAAQERGARMPGTSTLAAGYAARIWPEDT